MFQTEGVWPFVQAKQLPCSLKYHLDRNCPAQTASPVFHVTYFMKWHTQSMAWNLLYKGRRQRFA